MRRRKTIKPRKMTEQEKEIIKKIKSQDIASYTLARNYTHISWYDSYGKELGCIYQCSGFIIDAVIEQWKKCKEIKEND